MKTYSEAMNELKRNKRNNCEHLVRWNAGEGFTGEGHWCARRQRIITYVITNDGHVII